MVFSTGYQTNLCILSTLVGKDDHLIIDADSHASIYDGSKLGHSEVVRFRHNDPEDLRKRLRRLGDRPGEKLVVVEGIYSRSEEHTSELQSLMRNSYAVFCLKKKKTKHITYSPYHITL